ncbi:MAG: magnesium/cobalt transporter CorA [Acidobacteriota bacterium]|nr:MAG: magnesium/cobalt transporter CorA [Acidobacteriota bacterium]
MSRKKRTRKKTPGLSPGSLVYVGEQKADVVSLRVVRYSPSVCEERQISDPSELAQLVDGQAVTWLNVSGLHDTDLIASLGEVFSLHPLLLEDVLNIEQRPKIDSFPEHLFIVLKMLQLDSETHELRTEQVSCILGQQLVISFQETPSPLFEPVYHRIRGRKGRICTMPADYLAYALIDAVVDHYFGLIESLEERIERMEEEVFLNPTEKTLLQIQRTKTDLIHVRRSIWPLREAIGILLRDEPDLISEKVTIFLRDVYDHTIQVIDTLESIRDTNSGLMDIYLSMVSNRMNEVMKVLTIIATIFIPLTFMAGIYGMNFEYMPELSVHWAYPVLWLAMLTVAGVMVIYFKKKNWL